MIEHRHVYILFRDNETPAVLIKRINTENKYRLSSITFSSKERLERTLKDLDKPYISFQTQLAFWDAIKTK
jgi:CTP:phosphocholine cytidylyltransferase-like protein